MRALILFFALAACAAPPPSKSGMEALPLPGTRWAMIENGSTSGSPTLDFGEAGRASGFTGCNQWFAQVERPDGALQFRAIGMTRRSCEAPAMEVERAFADILARTRAARVEENGLTLLGDDDVELARFARVR